MSSQPRPEMWTPVDINSIPSPEETLNAKTSITKLERELADATLLLEQTKRRIEELNGDLERRRAWIAPIRRIPFELLSEIFELSSKASQLAPMTIAAVCRQWRAAVLATPRAWSFIYPQNYIGSMLPSEYVSTFLQRSNPCLLHLSIPKGSYVCSCYGGRDLDWTKCDCLNVDIVFHNAHRIRCLAVEVGWIDEFSTEMFPNLTHLYLRKRAGQMHHTIGRSQFPKLQFLDLSADGGLNTTVRLLDTHPLPLTHLELTMDWDDVWLDLVHHCASTLNALRLYGDSYLLSSERWFLNCPQLEYLALRDETPLKWHTDPKIITLKAHNLACYAYSTDHEAIQLTHQQTPDNLVKLKVDCNIRLADYPRIRTLQTRHTTICLDTLEQLERDTRLCPYLETIELTHFDEFFEEDSANHRLFARNQMAGSFIQFVVNTKWEVREPKYDYRCSVDMPCRRHDFA